ncbi:HAMP domain-containing sensor histidine kinase [Paenibacillus sp. BR2-3]|uniref:sensor histidine kinase n=1 Tax=Paenibacillus sp. BR2-3 TaxID=3048494 RepID=UPI003977C2F3
MKKKNRQVQHSKQINILFSLIFVLLVLTYTVTVIFLTGLDFTLLWLSFLFIVCMMVGGVAWIVILTRQITDFMENVDEIVDRAIQGREPITYYEETSLSSLEHKLMRYIDISKAKEQNIETEKNKIKGLISDISHQTKTPLANIMVYTQLLGEASELKEDSRHHVNDIKVQSDKLDWLIQSLIKLSRLETGMISLHIGDNPVIQTIKQTVSQVYAQSESKDIVISISCAAQLVARHDMKWTSEALFNLLENAVKYTGQGGKIHLSAESNEMFTRLDISDTGIGIPEEDLHSIFKRFYRGQNAREAEGIGIGLFLAREIITTQGGYIKVTSELGKGTTFSVFLPQL